MPDIDIFEVHEAQNAGVLGRGRFSKHEDGNPEDLHLHEIQERWDLEDFEVHETRKSWNFRFMKYKKMLEIE